MKVRKPTNSMRKEVFPYEVYTLGMVTCRPNPPNYGGWAYTILKTDEELYHESGYDSNRDDVYMTLYSMISAIEHCEKTITFKRDTYIKIYLDNDIVLDLINTRGYRRWINYGWKTNDLPFINSRGLWTDMFPYFNSQYYGFYDLKSISEYDSSRRKVYDLVDRETRDKEAFYERSRSSNRKHRYVLHEK